MLHLNTIRNLLVAGAFLAVASTGASAQSDSTRPSADTIAPSLRSESTATATATTGYVMSRSPTAAVLLSIVPGGGQLYNGQYIKSALFLAAGGYFAFQTIRYHKSFLEKVDEVDAIPLDDSTGAREFPRLQREFYRDNRDLNAAYFIGVQLLSMIDAYVGAHLFDFDVDDGEDGLSSRLYLDPMRPGVGLAMRW